MKNRRPRADILLPINSGGSSAKPEEMKQDFNGQVDELMKGKDADTHDRQPLDLDAENFFDSDSLRWYRRVFEDRNPGRRQTLSDMEFLREWGFVTERGGRLAPTRAAVLVLGRGRYVRQTLSRPVVDCQFIDVEFDSWTIDLRWSDRVVVEENLILAWLTLSERYMRRAERPFRIDRTTLIRNDDPLDYVSFREAAINLLLHQDYSIHGLKACIRFFRDRMVFWNPGHAFASADELLEPGEKETRNPDIVAAFRRLGLSEEAGAGIRAMFRNWQELGHVPPEIDNDKTKRAFEVRFLREELLSEEQRRLQTRLGLRLDDTEARVFAFACKKERVSLADAKAITGLTGAEAGSVLEALEGQGVTRRLQEGLYGLAPHLEGQAVFLSDQQSRIVAACVVPRSLAELMAQAGVTHRSFFRTRHLRPLLEAGIVRMTNPASPNAANQRYILTKAGQDLRAKQAGGEHEEKAYAQD